MFAHYLVGGSPETSLCGHAAGYHVSGLATDGSSLRRVTRSETPKHMGEPHPPRRFVLLARCRPSQGRFRARHSNLTGTERVFDCQSASHCHCTPGVQDARGPFLPMHEGTGFPTGSG